MANDKKDDRKQETPEDVAALYAWANMQNVKYRDFSANRREHRAQQQLQRPVVTRSEVAPPMKPPAPRPAPRIVPSLPGQLADPYRAPQHKSLVDSKRPTAFPAMPAARSVGAHDGGMIRPNMDGDVSAAGGLEKTSSSESWTSGANSPEDSPNVLRPANRAYSAPPAPAVVAAFVPAPMPAAPARVQPPTVTRTPVAARIEARPVQAAPVPAPPVAAAPMPAANVTAPAPVMEHYAPAPLPAYMQPIQPLTQPMQSPTRPIPPPVKPVAAPVMETPYESATAAPASWRFSDPLPEQIRGVEFAAPMNLQTNHFGDASERPAWLYEELPRPPVHQQPQTPASAAAPAQDTLDDTRERVASRWFALRGVFSGAQEQPAQQDLQTPVTAVFSLAGGVGKTSMVATLGRALSAAGERVLLADTTSYGLLPFYYGARELRPGAVRTFNPPPTTEDSPVSMVSYDVDTPVVENEGDWLLAALAGAARSSNRVIVDLATASSAVAKRILHAGPTVIVPIVADMSSVIGLSAVEQFFRNHRDGNGHVVQPYFVLNQFDPSQPLHLDVREVLRQQLGDRLLPIVLRRSQAVSEALAEGMTVMDYAPKSGIADDYAALANWLRNLQAPSQQAFRAMRWSEQ